MVQSSLLHVVGLSLVLVVLGDAAAIDDDSDAREEFADNNTTSLVSAQQPTSRQLSLPNFGSSQTCPNLPTTQTATSFRASAMENYIAFQAVRAIEDGLTTSNDSIANGTGIPPAAVKNSTAAVKNATAASLNEGKAVAVKRNKTIAKASNRALPSTASLVMTMNNKWMEMFMNAMKVPAMAAGGSGGGGFQLPNFGGANNNLMNGLGGGAGCGSLPAQRITPHFEQWLDENGYKQFRFVDNGCGKANSFGGQQSDSDKPSADKRPIIFVHGNSDCATGSGNMAGMSKMCGWTPNINFFMQKAGYKMADLYALTWGFNEISQASQQTHNKIFLQRINKFIEAVLTYTKAPKVDIISHSMGVTLARGAIVGINGCGNDLSSRVASFIGIAGANRGLSTCAAMSAFVPTCNAQNGFAPTSRYLAEINENGRKIADNVFSIWSPGDTLVKCETITPNTCIVPGQKCGVKVPGLDHIPVRDQTLQQQHNLLKTGQC